MDDLDLEMNRMLNDSIIFDKLTSLYGTIAGLSDGYLDICVKRCEMSREEATKRLFALDKKARRMVADAHKLSQLFSDQEEKDE